MTRLAWMGLGLGLLLVACGRQGGGGAGAAPAPSVSSVAVAVASPAPSSSASVAPPVPGVVPTPGEDSPYPRTVTPNPLAQRLCNALHGVPARRVAECCGGASPRFLEDQCVRVLSASLEAESVSVAESDVAKCEGAVAKATAGCDWVAPTTNPAPEACLGVVVGRRVEGSTCKSTLDCKAPLHCDGLAPGHLGVCRGPSADGASCGGPVDALVNFTLQRTTEVSHRPCVGACLVNVDRSRPDERRTCGAVPAEGAPCASRGGCAPDHHCVAGHCSAKAPPAGAATGKACTADADCATGGCVGGRCGKKCLVVVAAPPSSHLLPKPPPVKLPVPRSQ